MQIDAALQEKIEEENARLELTHLPGGPWVVTRRDPSVPNIDVCVYVRAGTWDEIEGGYIRGTAHLLEHAIGMENRKVGGGIHRVFSKPDQYGALTKRVETLYRGHLEKAMGLWPLRELLSFISHPAFSEEDIAPERNIIYHEWAIGLKSRQLSDASGVYGGSALEVHPLGETFQQAMSIPLDDLYAFHREHYRAGRTIVSVEGDIEHEAVCETVQKHLELPDGKPSRIYTMPSYVGNDLRFSWKPSLPGMVLCSLAIPIFSQNRIRPDVLAWEMEEHHKVGVPVHKETMAGDRLLYGEVQTAFVEPSGLCDETKLFYWSFETHVSFVESILRIIASELNFWGRWKADNKEKILRGMQSSEQEMFRKSLLVPVGARDIAERMAKIIFDNEPQETLHRDFHFRNCAALRPEDLNKAAQAAQKACPTFRAVGTLRGLPSRKKIQNIFVCS